ncbi:MAG TPA: hypothetical protein VKQ08_02610 [Cyclobacteriaceae bacterium]|nr:hypothetical protein [Cyclobacteriaceae bacterium]
MARPLSIVLVAFLLLLTLPLWLGLGGGLIGLTFGLIGGLIGLLFGLIGAFIGAIAWVFKGIFHLLFGWHHGFGFHPFHFNGYLFTAVLIVILVIALKRKN